MSNVCYFKHLIGLLNHVNYMYLLFLASDILWLPNKCILSNVQYMNRFTKTFNMLCSIYQTYCTQPSSAVGNGLAANTCLTAYPGLANSILARSHNFMAIDHEIISMINILLSTDSRNEALVNCLVKLVQEKVCLGELTVPTWP